MLATGIGWTKLSRKLGYGSGWTGWRRMREWSEAGVFDRLHQAVVGSARRVRWTGRGPVLVSVSVRARGHCPSPNFTDRAKRGTKYHLLVDAQGLPLNIAVSAQTGTTACWSSRS